MVDRVSR